MTSLRNSIAFDSNAPARTQCVAAFESELKSAYNLISKECCCYL